MRQSAQLVRVQIVAGLVEARANVGFEILRVAGSCCGVKGEHRRILFAQMSEMSKQRLHVGFVESHLIEEFIADVRTEPETIRYVMIKLLGVDSIDRITGSHKIASY